MALEVSLAASAVSSHVLANQVELTSLQMEKLAEQKRVLSDAKAKQVELLSKEACRGLRACLT